MQSWAPLEWPPGWPETLRRRGFLLGLPFLGPERAAYGFICDQLRSRETSCLDRWEAGRRELGLLCCDLIREELEWPNGLFIPEDPVEIACWDWRSVVIEEFRSAVLIEGFERAAGIPGQPGPVWEEAGSLTLGELVDWLLAMRPKAAMNSGFINHRA